MTAKSKTLKSRERMLNKGCRPVSTPPKSIQARRTDKDPTGRRLLQILDAFKK